MPGLHVNTQNGHWLVEPLIGYTGPYEIILGMDWLTRHHVLVDCAHYSLVFWAPERLPIKATLRGKLNGEGVFVGEKVEVNKRNKENLEDEGKEEEPFTMSENRNEWPYHVRKDIFKDFSEM